MTSCTSVGYIWQSQQDDAGEQSFDTVYPLSDGTYIVSGSTQANDIAKSFGTLSCYDDQGNQLWRENPADSDPASLASPCQDSSGHIIFAGSIKNYPAVFCFDQQGNMLWSTSLESGKTDLPLFYNGVFTSATELTDGTLMAIGTITTKSGEDGGSAIIAHFDEQGKLLWAKDLRGSLNAVWFDAVVNDSNNTVAISGLTYDYHAVVFKMTAQGNIIWSNNEANNLITSFRLIKNNDGGYIGFGKRRDSDNNENAVLEWYDANGNWLREQVVTGQYCVATNGLIQQADGSVLLYGSKTTGLGDNDIYAGFISRLDPDGNLISCHETANCSSIFDLTLDSDGNAIACGKTSADGAIIMKIAASAIQS
jgi:hypothetical protein